jgi:hypothetical protein
LGRPTSWFPCRTWRWRLVSVDHVKVHQAERTDAGRREIECHRGAEAAGTNQQHARRLEPPLARHPHFGQDKMPAVAQDLFLRQIRQIGSHPGVPCGFKTQSCFTHRCHPPAMAGTTVSSSPSRTAALKPLESGCLRH